MLFFPIILTIASCTLAAKLNVVYEWKYIDYDWVSEEQKNYTISKTGYDYTKIFTIDVEKVPDGRVFVTTPRLNPNAVPASLSTVSERNGPGGPLLKPYPNWRWYNLTNCRGITSVWRVTVDDCNRLWVLDSGKIGDDQVCPAQLLAFDLRSDNLLRRVTIPNNISHNPRNNTLGLLITPVIETEGFFCERIWVYIADVEGGGLIIYDGSNIWRIDNDVFNPDPDPAASTFNIAGDSFALSDGLLGLAVSHKGSSRNRRLYFRPLSSMKEYSFCTDDLHRSRLANNNVAYTTSTFLLPSQAAAQAFSRDNILFFGLATELAIACWNINTPMNDQNVVIVAQDDETLQFASGVKVARSSKFPTRDELWVTTNRLQKIWTGTQNFDEINYRILRAPVDSLVKNSRCQSPNNREP